MAKIRENLKGRTLEEALKRTIEYCNGQGILVKFLKENALEVVNMLDTQFTFEDAVKVWKDEAREEGLEEGNLETAKSLKYMGLLTPSQISTATGLPLDVITRL